MNALRAELERLLGEPVPALSPVSGGDINRAYQAIASSGRRVFVKTHDTPPPAMYRREAEGLAWLRLADSLRIPAVLGVSERALVLEWIESKPRRSTFEQELGRGLAALHRSGAAGFGFASSGFIGSLPQENSARATWAEFYAKQRLLPFAERAQRAGTLSPQHLRRVEALCVRLPLLCGDAESPARLHGDLWSGNVMADEHGAPVLFDPAAYGGDREVDLAMLRLFGAPSARFFAAYEEVYRQKAGAEERVALYQLLPLLVHVCLFGTSYVAQVERALRYYE